jgi:RecA/RadA recombinase
MKLLVIDSITALFRTQYATKEAAIERAIALHEHAKQLKKLSDEFGIPVLVVNQVIFFWVFFFVSALRGAREAIQKNYRMN